MKSSRRATLALVAVLSGTITCSDSGAPAPEPVLVTVEGYATSELDGHALAGFEVELSELFEEPNRTVTNSDGWYRISWEAGGPDCVLHLLMEPPPEYSEEGGVRYLGGYYNGPFRGEYFNVTGDLSCRSGVQRIDWSFVPLGPDS
jgi:hypothetical protein